MNVIKLVNQAELDSVVILIFICLICHNVISLPSQYLFEKLVY